MSTDRSRESSAQEIARLRREVEGARSGPCPACNGEGMFDTDGLYAGLGLCGACRGAGASVLDVRRDTLDMLLRLADAQVDAAIVAAQPRFVRQVEGTLQGKTAASGWDGGRPSVEIGIEHAEGEGVCSWVHQRCGELAGLGLGGARARVTLEVLP